MLAGCHNPFRMGPPQTALEFPTQGLAHIVSFSFLGWQFHSCPQKHLVWSTPQKKGYNQIRLQYSSTCLHTQEVPLLPNQYYTVRLIKSICKGATTISELPLPTGDVTIAEVDCIYRIPCQLYLWHQRWTTNCLN